MTIIIKSQNKENIEFCGSINYQDKAYYDDRYDDTSYTTGHFILSNNMDILGAYDSKERCLEIIDEIFDKLTPRLNIRLGDGPYNKELNSGEVLIKDGVFYNTEVIQTSDFLTYEMPEK